MFEKKLRRNRRQATCTSAGSSEGQGTKTNNRSGFVPGMFQKNQGGHWIWVLSLTVGWVQRGSGGRRRSDGWFQRCGFTRGQWDQHRRDSSALPSSAALWRQSYWRNQEMPCALPMVFKGPHWPCCWEQPVWGAGTVAGDPIGGLCCHVAWMSWPGGTGSWFLSQSGWWTRWRRER